MRKWILHLFLFVAYVMSPLASMASNSPTVYLQSEQTINLRQVLRQWVPPLQTDSPESAFKALNDGKFTANNDMRIKPDQHSWYAFRYFAKPGFADRDVLLRFVVGSEFEADIFYLQNNQWQSIHVPDFANPIFLQLQGGGYGVKLPVDQNIENTVLIKPTAQIPVNMRLDLTTERYYYRSLVEKQIPLLLSLGAIIALMLMVAFWKWRNSKLRFVFLFYAALNIFSGLFFYGYIPQLFQYFWFEIGQVFTVIYLLGQALLLWLVAMLVELDKDSPKLMFAYRFLMLAFFTVIFSSIFFSVWFIFIIFLTLVLLALVLEFVLAIRAILLGSPVGFYVAMVTVATFGLVSLQAWRNADLLQSENVYMIASQLTTLALFLSLALAVLRYGRTFASEGVASSGVESRRVSTVWANDIATLSQELRTPATGVIGMAQLLQRSGLTPSQRHYANIIVASANDIVDTLGAVLDITKISTGSFSLNAVPFSMEQLFQFLADFFEFDRTDVSARFNGQFLEKMPTFYLGDQVRLQEVIAISMRTLLRFSNERLEFNVTSSDKSTADNILLRFSIEAKDVRLSQEAKQRFVEICNAATEQEMLLGGARGSAELGLVLVKKIISELGGDLGVEYSNNRSMSIWFTVRLAIDFNKQLKFDKEQAQLRNKRLAIIFSSPMFAANVANHFKSWNMDVDVIDDSGNWLSFDFESYDLILLSNACGWPVLKVLERARQLNVPVLLSDSNLNNQVALTDIPNMRIAYFSLGTTLPDMCAAMIDLLSNRDVSHFSKTTANSGVFNQFKVLLAEDNPVNQQVITAMLRNLGIEADCVADGSEVLTQIFERPEYYDLILMDYDMPQMNGVDTARALRMRRRNSAFKPLIICGLTAHATTEVRELCIASGMDAVLVKPVNMGVLEEYLRSVFERLDKNDRSVL